MNLRTALASLLGRGEQRAPRVRVQVLIKGRIGEAGTTSTAHSRYPPVPPSPPYAQREGLPLRDAIEASPHLRHTLMWTGERCPVDEHAARPLEDGDSLYLLAPIAGG